MNKIIFVLSLSLFFIFSCKTEKNKNNDIEESMVDAAGDSVLIAFNERIKKNPNDANVYHERALYYFEEKNNVDAALADMGRVFAVDTLTAKYFITLADLYLAKRMAGNVKASLNKAIEIDAKNVAAITKLAELNLYIKDYNACLKAADDVLKIDVHNPRAYFIKGIAFKELGDSTKAVSSFQTVIEQDPDYYNAYVELGLLYSSIKNPVALDYFNNALNINPKSIEVYYGIGMFAQETGNYNKAIEAYNTILKIDSTYNDAHFNLGYIHLVYLKDYPKAVLYYSNNIKFHPTNFEAYYMRGMSYQKMNDKQNAEADYRKALGIYPQYEPAALALGNLIDR
jgi:tetratricopeptide (TPR) repeat protein